MTCTKILHRKSDPGNHENNIGARPRFNSQLTSDRLRESFETPTIPMPSNIRKGRRSIFREEGLTEEEIKSQDMSPETRQEEESGQVEGIGSTSEISSPVEALKPSHTEEEEEEEYSSRGKSRWFSKLAQTRRPTIKSASSAPPPTIAGLHRLSMIVLLITIVLPTISFNNGRKKVEISGADAGVIRSVPNIILDNRDTSPTTVCTRWAGQSKSLWIHIP